jgi:hypothetical protein
MVPSSGVHSVAYAFPNVRIVTGAVDAELNESFHILPGIGKFISQLQSYTALLSPGQTRKHCCGNICDSRCFLKCFPVCPHMETLLRKQNLLPEIQRCFLANSETFDVSLCFSLMFPSVCPLLETWRNIGRKQCFLVCPGL